MTRTRRLRPRRRSGFRRTPHPLAPSPIALTTLGRGGTCLSVLSSAPAASNLPAGSPLPVGGSAMGEGSGVRGLLLELLADHAAHGLQDHAFHIFLGEPGLRFGNRRGR